MLESSSKLPPPSSTRRAFGKRSSECMQGRSRPPQRRSHMVRKRSDLRRRVGSAQKPHANLVKKRNSEPCKAIELLGMHGGTARGIFHLEDIARGMLAPAYDFLGVVAKEHERIAAARTHVAVFLRDFVIDVSQAADASYTYLKPIQQDRPRRLPLPRVRTRTHRQA